MPQTRWRVSYVPVTCSTFPWSRWSMSRAFYLASSRNVAALSAMAPRCCTPMPPARHPRLRSYCANPTADPISPCAAESGADTGVCLANCGNCRHGIEAAVKILYRKEIDKAEDRTARAAELAQEYRDEFASPYEAASNFYITDVIEPCETRAAIALALRKTLNKMSNHDPARSMATCRYKLLRAYKHV